MLRAKESSVHQPELDQRRGAELAPVLMVQGTASSVGKSVITAGLCRLLTQRGLRVAPFKAQNMSNNAAACGEGREMGRAQFVQALAAGVTPRVEMNPVLLKPQGNDCQVVVLGEAQGVLSSGDYFQRRRESLWPVITTALDSLRSSYDLVIAEGAGSPAEINLRSRDVVNMSVALYSGADVLLVGDIDRGGVFAALLGTWEWLNKEERALLQGFVLNKFRGNPSLLSPAPEMLAERTGVAIRGTIPFVPDLGIAEEDSASVTAEHRGESLLDICIVRYPHMANFDEFGPLQAEREVALRYVSRPEQLRAPDLVILPGTKATPRDLTWLWETDLASRIRWLANQGTPVLGVCGGYQMLGRRVLDPLHLESDLDEVEGLGLLPVQTTLTPKKIVRQTGGHVLAASGVWGSLSGRRVEGYEIHTGRSVAESNLLPFLQLESGLDGSLSTHGTVAGTYLHGLLETDPVRRALLSQLASLRGFSWSPDEPSWDDPFDRLAAVLAQTLDLQGLPSLQRARSVAVAAV